VAAAQVFEERGFAAGTTNRIAERAGVSIGTLYQYFPGKEALAALLVERHVAEMLAGVDAWAGSTSTARPGLRESLRSLVELALAQHEAQPRLHHMLLADARLPEPVQRTVLAAERRGAAAIADALRVFPEVRRADLRRAGTILVQATLGLTHRFIEPGGAAMPRAAFAAELVDLLQGYLERAATG